MDAACTDGGLVEIGDSVPHPRFYGAFSARSGSTSTSSTLLDLPSAIRSMTSLPAGVFMEDRGWIRPGMRADIVFDPARVRDLATYDKPHRMSKEWWPSS